MKPFTHHALALAAITALHVSAHAVETTVAEGTVAKATATATLGTMIRTSSPDPQDYALIPSSTVPGAATGGLVGQTGGSDLNFERGKPVSTALKMVSDLEVRAAQWGAFARVSAWTDFTLGHASARYGNFADGYAADSPLSDRYFATDAKFDGAELRDLWVSGHATPSAESQLDVRVGRQVLSWGTALMVTGGVNSAINPSDLAAQFRPGALPVESKVPLGMIDVKFALGQAASVEAFVPWESGRTVLPGCGTFFDVASLLAHNCNLSGALSAPIPGTPVSTLGSLTEHSLLQNQYYVHRAPDEVASPGGQYGLALRANVAPLSTDVAAYAMQMNQSAPLFGVQIEDVNGGTLPAGLGGGLARLSNPDGLKYYAAYARGVRLLGLSTDTKIDPTWHLLAEAARRPNQPLGINANDLLSATLLRAPTSLLQQTHDILAVPAGGHFDAWDRYGVTTASLGTTKAFLKTLGTDRIVLALEAGGSHVSDLPDPSVMRYGRPLAYGSAPYLLNGTLTPCSEAAPGLSGVAGKTCTTDGFVSSTAWGLRGRVAATWRGILGAALTPSLAVAQDMHGWSYDGSFSQGRRTIRAGLRAEWAGGWFADAAYTAFSGGRYNLLSDRDNLALVGGVSF